MPAAVVFDLFGTLLDIASLQRAVSALTADPSAFVATWREKQLAYAAAATIMERYEDFDELTGRALRFAAARHAVTLRDLDHTGLVAAWAAASPFADVVSALEDLRRAGLPCAVLTNGTRATSRAALDRAGLATFFEVALTVEAVRTYKPSPRVYALATEHYGVAAERLTFVTANGWDATGAAAFGLRVVWCNRTGAPAETFGPAPARVIGSLRELAAEFTR